jgi:hypothetical protein
MCEHSGYPLNTHTIISKIVFGVLHTPVARQQISCTTILAGEDRVEREREKVGLRQMWNPFWLKPEEKPEDGLGLLELCFYVKYISKISSIAHKN